MASQEEEEDDVEPNLVGRPVCAEMTDKYTWYDGIPKGWNQCLTCLQLVTIKNKGQHLQTHSPPSFECSSCDYKAKRLYTLTIHIKNNHADVVCWSVQGVECLLRIRITLWCMWRGSIKEKLRRVWRWQLAITCCKFVNSGTFNCDPREREREREKIMLDKFSNLSILIKLINEWIS